jgi:hypothetical protein
VQARGRGGDRTVLGGVDGLIAPAIGFVAGVLFGSASDVGRERHASDGVQHPRGIAGQVRRMGMAHADAPPPARTALDQLGDPGGESAVGGPRGITRRRLPLAKLQRFTRGQLARTAEQHGPISVRFALDEQPANAPTGHPAQHELGR